MAEPQGNEISAFSNTQFTSKLYDVLKNTSGNVFFSPYSLQVALAMTYSGATANTAKELQQCLAFSEDKDALFKAVKESAATLKSGKDVTLNMANGIFVQENFDVKEDFSNNLKTVFEAEAKQLNFGKSAEAASEINQYVSKNTNGKIPQLFSSDAFNALTRLVLVNAIYFKGTWVNKFDVRDTSKGDFFLNNNDKVEVDFMTINKRFNASENEDLKSTIVELPYEGDISMVLVVPNEIEGIKHLENKIKEVDLRTLTDNTESRQVHLTMPKFKLEQKLELVDSLKELGIHDMFDSNKARFEGISDKEDLYVSRVVQKAYIEVNEEGSEAAAATAVRFVLRMMPVSLPLELDVKGPFMFFLRHACGAVLFAGRVSKP